MLPLVWHHPRLVARSDCVNPAKLAGATFSSRWSEMAGGTPNYAARLLKNFPVLGRYVALAYFVGWVTVPAVHAIILTDLIKTNLEPWVPVRKQSSKLDSLRRFYCGV